VTAVTATTSLATEPRPASVGRRAVAYVVDSVLVLCSTGWLFGLLASALGDDGYWTGYLLVYFWYLTLPAIALYWALALAVSGALNAGRTPGKALVGIAVRDAATGGRAGLGQLLGRELLRGFYALLLLLPLAADALSALWHPERRTWHDRSAGTVVVVTRPALLPSVARRGPATEPRAAAR
jgi:uncharacterized RDD family membrane protein YckC